MSFMRRILPLLLVACLAMTMLPAAALAADTNPLDPRSAAGHGFPTPSPRQGARLPPFAAKWLLRQPATGTLRARRFFAPRSEKNFFFSSPRRTPTAPAPPPTRPPRPRRAPPPTSRRALHRPGGSFFFLFPAHPAFVPSVRRFPLDLRIRFKQLKAPLPLELAHRQQVCLARQILVEHLVPEADFVRVLARAAVVHHRDVGP